MSITNLVALERQEQIVEQINSVKRTTVAELSHRFQVSEATIRRDLAVLAQRGLVRRMHGGVLRAEGFFASTEIPVLQRQGLHSEAKERIGAAAAKLIRDGETLFITGGSTTLMMARHLAGHRNLTIITDSILVVQELFHQKYHRCMILGGMIDYEEMAVRGPIARHMMGQFHVDKVILGARAISIERGISLETPEETELFRIAMNSGRETLLITDSTKFDQSAFMYLAPINAVHTLVTDTGLDQSLAQQIRELNIELILA